MSAHSAILACVNAKTRAAPLSPEARRAVILDAVIPLLLDRGASVTTAEMAKAAGVAEGTIFRVFADKTALLHAVLMRAFDPGPVQRSLTAIDEDLPLRDQLVAATTSLTEHFDRVTALLGVLRSIPHTKKPNNDTHRMATEAMSAIVRSLAEILQRHRDQLSVEPSRAATVLRSLIFTNAHEVLTAGERMTPDEMVDILLGGVGTRETS